MNKKKEYTVIQCLASCIQARTNCADGKNNEWFDRWDSRIDWLVDQFLPHGSGFDCGSKVDLDLSSDKKVVITADYHAMNDAGFYDGWYSYRVTITPAFDGFNLRVTGSNRNGLREYVGDTFSECLGRVARVHDYSEGGLNQYGYYLGYGDDAKWVGVEI